MKTGVQTKFRQKQRESKKKEGKPEFNILKKTRVMKHGIETMEKKE